LPTHIGFIVDGNRRWARARKLPTKAGHRRGYDVLKELAYVAKARGIKYVSAFVLSTDNLEHRSKSAVAYYMELSLWAFAHDMKQMVKDGFKIIFLGRREHLSAEILHAMDETEAESAGNRGTTLALCFNYGGQAEIADACRAISAKIARGELTADEITEETVAQNLYHAEIPPLDLLVRTSGEQRLSGFMLWRAAYAELLWIDKMWPDMTEKDFDDVLAEYARRERRFGK